MTENIPLKLLEKMAREYEESTTKIASEKQVQEELARRILDMRLDIRRERQTTGNDVTDWAFSNFGVQYQKATELYSRLMSYLQAGKPVAYFEEQFNPSGEVRRSAVIGIWDAKKIEVTRYIDGDFPLRLKLNFDDRTTLYREERRLAPESHPVLVNSVNEDYYAHYNFTVGLEDLVKLGLTFTEFNVSMRTPEKIMELMVGFENAFAYLKQFLWAWGAPLDPKTPEAAREWIKRNFADKDI